MRALRVVCLILITYAFSASADDALVTPCFECHGDNGQSTDGAVPTIAGQSAFFMEESLFAFQAADRPCGDPDHCDLVNEMSENDIATVSEFFSGQSFVSQTQETDPALVEVGRAIHERECGKCHTKGGSVADDDAGILAGQWMPYLQNTMQDYLSGDRMMQKKMEEKMEKLSESDVEALAHYYGSQGG